MTVIDTSAAAFLAGLVTSLHCVGMCGPLSCSWALSGKQGRFMQSTAAYHASRLASYATVGTLAGSLGAMPLSFFHHGAGLVLPWLLVLVFISIGIGIDRWMPQLSLLRAPLRRIQLFAFQMPSIPRAVLIGFATPLLPCGPLYMMFGLAMANGSAALGAEFATAFGLGTLPLLVLAQTQLHRLTTKWPPGTMQRVQRGLALVAAVVLAWRLRGTLDFGSDAVPSCCHAGL
jgi:uncharacterized protein